MWSDLQDFLAESFEIRNSLVGKGSIPEQTASLYLFDKDGRLARQFLVGVDSQGDPIPPDWYADEVCGSPENSFTWRAVQPAPGAQYGSPLLAKDLDEVALPPLGRQRYAEILGTLRSAIALPLNGINRTFGVLEVINRLDHTMSPVSFREEDVVWASIIGSSIASAITNIRRRLQFDSISRVGSLIAAPSDLAEEQRKVYHSIASELVAPDQRFRAAIIRLVAPAGQLRVVGKAIDGLTWDQWLPEHPRPERSIAREVVRTREPEWCSDVAAIRHRLGNCGWFDINHIMGYGCVPLLVREKAVGTLSVFTTYPHEFNSDETRYLGTLASLIATFAESARVVGELTQAWEQLQGFFEAQRTNDDDEITRYRHQLKNDLT
jgi:GAF domain-containing protein